MDLHCFNIDYFPREEYSPDPNDSTMAIPYAVTKSALFFMLATLLLFLGEFCCLFGHFVRHRRIFTFVSGVVFIISGLLMLIGLVMYISIFKAEIGSKLRPRSQLQPPLFTYRYGFSFLLVVGGFMSTEIAGTCAIFLYIYWHQKEWLRKRHEHRRKLSSSSALLDHHHPPFPQCRRHPHHSYYPPPPPPRSPAQPRRLYLDQDPDPGGGIDIHSGEPSPCRHHSHRHHLASLTGSMRDVATSASYYSFPAPPPALGVSPCHHHFCDEAPPPPRQHLGGSARELTYFPRDATTNTVSTTADINSCGDIGPPEDEEDEEEDYSPDLHHEHEFVTFDLDEHPPPAPPVRTIPPPPLDEPSPHPRRKDFTFDTLRRTTPV